MHWWNRFNSRDISGILSPKYLERVVPSPAIFDWVISCLTAEKAFHIRHMLGAGPVTVVVWQNTSGCNNSILLLCWYAVLQQEILTVCLVWIVMLNDVLVTVRYWREIKHTHIDIAIDIYWLCFITNLLLADFQSHNFRLYTTYSLLTDLYMGK